MEMNYNEHNTESTDFDYKSFSSEEDNTTNNSNQENKKSNRVVWIVLLLLLLLASIGAGGFFFMNNKKLELSEAKLTKEKIILLSKVDSLQNEIVVIYNRYKVGYDNGVKEIAVLKKRVNYFKNLVDYDCKGKLEKSYQQIKVYQQQVEDMQITIDSLKSVIAQLEQNSSGVNQVDCQERIKFVIDSMLKVIPAPKTVMTEVRVVDTLMLAKSAQATPTFTVNNFKYTGVYHTKKEPEVDLETILSYKMEEFLVSFDLESDKIVVPRFLPTIYVSVISNKDNRTISASEDQPEVFTLDGKAIEYTISEVPDFGDKIRATMQLKWPALKSNRPKDPKDAEYTIVIYTDKEKLSEFQGTLQYGKAPIFW